MNKTIAWEEVYNLWKYREWNYGNKLSKPIPIDKIFVDYNRDGYIYGYDWLTNEAADNRKEIIEKNPLQFLLFTEPSNKGTIRTATMLAEAKDDEERAAIWIAATSNELMQHKSSNEVARYAEMINITANLFLRDRFYMWHHAMKRLVPEIQIPSSIISGLNCKNAGTVMDLIQMNTVMLQSTHRTLLYSSLGENETEAVRSVRCDE